MVVSDFRPRSVSVKKEAVKHHIARHQRSATCGLDAIVESKENGGIFTPNKYQNFGPSGVFTHRHSPSTSEHSHNLWNLAQSDAYVQSEDIEDDNTEKESNVWRVFDPVIQKIEDQQAKLSVETLRLNLAAFYVINSLRGDEKARNYSKISVRLLIFRSSVFWRSIIFVVLVGLLGLPFLETPYARQNFKDEKDQAKDILVALTEFIFYVILGLDLVIERKVFVQMLTVLCLQHFYRNQASIHMLKLTLVETLLFLSCLLWVTLLVIACFLSSCFCTPETGSSWFLTKKWKLLRRCLRFPQLCRHYMLLQSGNPSVECVPPSSINARWVCIQRQGALSICVKELIVRGVSNDRFSFSFLPTQVGVYVVQSFSFSFSKELEFVPGPVDPQETLVFVRQKNPSTITFPQQAKVGSTLWFQVILRDSFGNKQTVEKFVTALVKKTILTALVDDSKLPAVTFSFQSGSYTGSFTPKSLGKYGLEISVGDAYSDPSVVPGIYQYTAVAGQVDSSRLVLSGSSGQSREAGSTTCGLLAVCLG